MEYRHPLSPLVTLLERAFGWAAFPSPIRILVIFQVAATLLSRGVPGYRDLLLLDKEQILEHHQIWRLLTFLFSTDTHPILLIFLLFIMWMINDGMESEWGAFRVNFYLFGTWLGMVVAAWVLPSDLQHQMLGIETGILYSSLFMAFATLHPKQEILLFFVLPVQVRWLALINAVALIQMAVSAFALPVRPSGVGALPVVLGMTPYLLVFLPKFLHAILHRGQSAARQSRFRSRQIDPGQAFHVCAKCGLTDQERPEIEFRVAADGEDYCPACRPPS
ncbi:MAG: hypothetical protein KGS60_01005 [Verrucomicrobia bacterium]|nr:hypothetical protein [Verrucomicrobiota bacterium]